VLDGALFAVCELDLDLLASGGLFLSGFRLGVALISRPAVIFLRSTARNENGRRLSSVMAGHADTDTSAITA
jgi:hypothetical protein